MIMRGQVAEIYKIFEGSSKKLVIPVYQRNYDWKIKQCAQLLEDLVDLHEHNRPKHFFGAIVGKPETSFKWVVIDGQQRLTTVSLLILALSQLVDSGALTASDPDLGRKLRKNYLIADAGERDGKFRLKPVKDDNSAYQRLFCDDESEYIHASNVTSNYRYLLEELPQRGLSGDEWWNAISRLEVMHLDLENHDDPQRIFESLNSTGLALSEADKVRNLVLMGLESDEQQYVYEQYWNRIEKNVNFETDAFLRRYLISVTHKLPNANAVFEAFKEFATKRGTKGAELLAEVREYSTHARDIEQAQTGHREIDLHLQRLNLLRIDVTLPFLMPVMGDFKRGDLQADDFVEILQILESYLARRLFCGINTAGLNYIFARLYRDVRRWWSPGERLSEVVAYALLVRAGASSGVFPDDTQFAEGFVTRDVYRLGGERHRYIFECLENQGSKDVRDIATRLQAGSLSVEHIMPRTLTNAWRETLGPAAEQVHATWINRIANLTVTGYNPEYSNASFQQKKQCDHGFDHSPYRLNELLKEHSSWGEAELKQRSDQLLAIALNYWKYPTTTFEPPAPALPTEPLGQHTDFTHRRIAAYEWQGTRHTVRSWRQFIVSIVRQLLPEHRAQIFEYAKGSSDFQLEPLEKNSPFGTVTDGLAVWVHSDTRQKCAVLRRLFHSLNIDPDDLTIVLHPSGKENEAAQHAKNAKYGELGDFLPLLAELANAEIDDDDVAALAAEFTEAFSPYMINDPQARLGRKFADELMASGEFLADASEELLLAVLSSAVLMSKGQLDPAILRRTIVEGSLQATLGQLLEVANRG